MKLSRRRWTSRAPDPGAVDWTWVPCGLPVMTVQLAVPLGTVAAFLDGLRPMPFVRVRNDDGQPPEVRRTYEPVGLMRAHRSRGRWGDRLDLYASGAQGSVLALAGAWSPVGKEREFGQELLRRLALNVLGPITWDLVDADYGVCPAYGDDGVSLLTFLSPGSVGDREALRTSWSPEKTTHGCNATAATTVDELTGILSRGLGSAAPLAGADFDTWLATQPAPSLPKHVRIHLTSSVYHEHQEVLHKRLYQAQPRIIWSYQPV
jgi:hypothetical protein